MNVDTLYVYLIDLARVFLTGWAVLLVTLSALVFAAPSQRVQPVRMNKPVRINKKDRRSF